MGRSVEGLVGGVLKELAGGAEVTEDETPETVQLIDRGHEDCGRCLKGSIYAAPCIKEAFAAIEV